MNGLAPYFLSKVLRSATPLPVGQPTRRRKNSRESCDANGALTVSRPSPGMCFLLVARRFFDSSRACFTKKRGVPHGYSSFLWYATILPAKQARSRFLAFRSVTARRSSHSNAPVRSHRNLIKLVSASLRLLSGCKQKEKGSRFQTGSLFLMVRPRGVEPLTF